MNMSSTVKKVFIVLGALLAGFLIWNLVFASGGIIKTGYNAIATGVNTQVAKIAGSSTKLLPAWGSADSSTKASSGGFGATVVD